MVKTEAATSAAAASVLIDIFMMISSERFERKA
jgi:hypothetical protein